MLVRVIDSTGKVEKMIPDELVQKFLDNDWTVLDDYRGPDVVKKRGRPKKEQDND